ncbi:hypothetical protein SLS62_006986 [Diatrype stigma]|uniref:Uncharacterized protein n=1 Tax=Diatrype stigma TaxID=117547 RepID=A0AAN9UND1_9PEZI
MKAVTTYREFVKFRQQNNPCILGLSHFLDKQDLRKEACRIWSLNCVPQDIQGAEPQGFEEVPADNLHLMLEAPLPADHGRILIVEDIHPSVVEILGKALDIDPAFFADHVVTKYAEIEISPAPPSVALTSSRIVSEADRFNIHFQKMVDLGAEENFRNSPWTLQTLTNVPRSVRRLAPVSGRQIAINRSCCSVLSRTFDQGWIVIGEWMLYSQVMGRYLVKYEYSFKNIESVLHGVNDDIIELQKWRHRAIQSQYKIQSARQFIAHRLTEEKRDYTHSGPWDLILKDLDHLSNKIEYYGQSLERMIPVVTSMVQLLDSRRSIAEAVNVRRLTIIALVFVPLSWVASLFSMADGYAPGQPMFWIYFVVAVPVCILIAGFSLLAKF